MPVEPKTNWKTLAVRLERRSALLLGGFLALYAAAVYVLSRRKFMWNDELFTYYIARLPSMTDVWGALLSGGEQLPPFFYVATRASIALFGDGKHAFRLPEMLGFAVMCLCLFVFVARRASNFAALFAALFPLVTFAFFYATDARPYGLVLGFSALSLVGWQSVAMDRRRALSLAALALSLAGAVSSHYYGLFVVLPLALGEAVRTRARGRVDKAVWAAFLLSATPLLVHLPLIEQARRHSGAFWSPPLWMNIPSFFFNLLYMAVIPLVCLVLIGSLYRSNRRFFRVAGEAREREAKRLPRAEAVAAAGYLLLPVICVILAKTVTGAFTDRYAVAAVIGLSALVAFAAARLLGDNAPAFALLLAGTVGWLGLLIYNESWKASLAQTAPQQKIELVARASETELPIVAADPYTFIELSHYAPEEMRRRVVYFADPEISLRRLKHNSLERGMGDLLGPWFGLKVEDYRAAVARTPRFLLVGDPDFFSWIVPQLIEDGRRIELLGLQSGVFLYRVEPGGENDRRAPEVK